MLISTLYLFNIYKLLKHYFDIYVPPLSQIRCFFDCKKKRCVLSLNCFHFLFDSKCSQLKFQWSISLLTFNWKKSTKETTHAFIVYHSIIKRCFCWYILYIFIYLFIWDLKNKGINPKLTWEIIDCANSYKNGNKTCDLFLTEKYHIITSKLSLLNKRTELISKFRHLNKFLLNNYKYVQPD